jgi:hypothetical protein
MTITPEQRAYARLAGCAPQHPLDGFSRRLVQLNRRLARGVGQAARHGEGRAPRAGSILRGNPQNVGVSGHESFVLDDSVGEEMC